MRIKNHLHNHFHDRKHIERQYGLAISYQRFLYPDLNRMMEFDSWCQITHPYSKALLIDYQFFDVSTGQLNYWQYQLPFFTCWKIGTQVNYFFRQAFVRLCEIIIICDLSVQKNLSLVHVAIIRLNFASIIS